MRKHLLLAVSVTIVTGALAQNHPQTLRPGHNVSKLKPLVRTDYFDPNAVLVNEPNFTVSTAAQPRTNTETIIGITTYDLQSNAAVQNRVLVYPDEKVSAVWTTSQSGDLAAADRGTGYNHFDGNGWVNGTGSSAIIARAESEKTGWPSIMDLGPNEGFIAHNASDELVLTQNNSEGSTLWTEAYLPGNIDSLLWPRAEASVTGDTIHLFALTIPTGNGGAIYQGLDGAMTYSRSTDGGTTWDIQKQILPGMTAADGFFGFSGDSYSMDVKGDNVVLLIGDQWYDTFIMKSTDGGDSWTKEIVWDFPINNYDHISDNQLSDVNNDGIADTILSNDGSMWVSIDNAGMAHCFFGQLRGLNDVTGDASSSFFPITDGLCYWNENMMMNQFDTIAFVQDLNNNDTLDLADIGTYFLSMTSMPSAMVDSNGDIYVTFSSVVEGTDLTFGKAFRNVYAIKSTDGGNTWTTPVNVTPSDFDEAVFASIGTMAPTYLHVVYQRDEQPGLAVRGDEHSFGPNSIVYLQLNKAIDVSVEDVVAEKTSNLEIYPNPAKGTVRVAFENGVGGNATVSLTNILGATVASFNRNITAGANQVDIDLTNVQAGVYFVTVQTANGASSKKLIVQ